jgi:hypothetical protein
MKRNLRNLIIFPAGVLALVVFLCCNGCANQTVKERLVIEFKDGKVSKVEYRPELAYWSLLSFTDAQNIEHITSTSSTCIGEWETYSDPNSIESAEGLIGSVIRAAIIN